MRWSDAIAPPSERLLRQFAALWLALFAGVALWRAWSGADDSWTLAAAFAAVVVGGAGLLRPSSIRWIYSGWMILAFPIGWTITQVMLVVLFAALFTPIALVFRLMGRDALAIKRRAATTYWIRKASPSSSSEYLREY